MQNAIQTVVLAGPLLDEISEKIGDIKTLLITLITMIAVWLAAKQFFRTGSITAVLLVIASAVLVLWGVNNIDWLKTQLNSELRSASPVASTVLPVDQIGGESWTLGTQDKPSS